MLFAAALQKGQRPTDLFHRHFQGQIQVLKRTCGSHLIISPWYQQTGVNQDSLNMVEQQEQSRRVNSGLSLLSDWSIDSAGYVWPTD